MNYSEKLKIIRKDKNLKMKEVAEKAGISQSSLSYIESGSNTPSIETLSSILSVYGMSLSDFFNEDSNAVVLTPELKRLFEVCKDMSPEQIDALIKFVEVCRR